MLEKIDFLPLQEAHLALMHYWFNQPHVQAFYSLRNWTDVEVKNKLLPYIQGIQPVQGFVAYVNKKPIGYLQFVSIMGLIEQPLQTVWSKRAPTFNSTFL